MAKPVSRYFNKIKISKNRVTKTSTHKTKLINEINWYRELPNDLKKYIPQILDSSINIKTPFIEMENCGPDLGTLYCLDKKVDWELYFTKIVNCMKDLHSHKKPYSLVQQMQRKMYQNKTLDRIIMYHNSPEFARFLSEFTCNGKTLPGLNNLLSNLNNISKEIILDNLSDNLTIIHGDIFLGNIIQSNREIKLVDPRGSFGGTKGIYGHAAYDWAKLAHCIIYDYTLITNNRFDIDEKLNYTIKITEKQKKNKLLMQKIFLENCPYKEKTIDLICCLLFVSMIPLHKDDYKRQCVLLQRGLEIYKKVLDNEL